MSFARCCILLVALHAGAVAAFDFDDVAELAQLQARQSYRSSSRKAPAQLQALNYDQYRDIRFRPDRALWRAEKLPFEVMFFHLGKSQSSVRIEEVSPQGTHHIPYRSGDFDFGKNKLSPQSWGDLGFGGFRAHYPLNAGTYKDELVVFLGASYFRALGAGQRYGLSARGLAIDTVGGQGEEFPDFTRFWLVKPSTDATTLTIYALLDSPRATGAYQFDVHPGSETVMDVHGRIFLRASVATLGIAPLTSMFHHGENGPTYDDFRPEVHDSDGLLLATADDKGGDEWLWRPLINPARPLATSFEVGRLRGFGLMQRDRTFSDYEDLEAHYELRPSAWVVPEGDWGPGRVQLLQLPTPNEFNDNVVAYWVPAHAPAPGQPLDIAYRIFWQGDAQQRSPNGWTVQTRRGSGSQPMGRDEFQYVVDFAGPALDALPADAEPQAVVTPLGNAELIESNAYRNDATGGWRMTLRVKRTDRSQPVELRAFLQLRQLALTETWTSLIPAD